MGFSNLLRQFRLFSIIAISCPVVPCQRITECNELTAGWLRCKDDPSQCVNDDALCDGVRDCNDATDEVAYGWAPKNQCHPGRLTSYTCPEFYFKCHTLQNTGCLSNDYLCDGEENCQDHTDEKNCPNIHFQLSSSTVLGVFIFALLIFTVTLCIAVLGVYATNKARGRRRRAAQRQEEQRSSRLRNVFSVTRGAPLSASGSAAPEENEGLDNPNYDGDGAPDLVAPPPYALVIEAGLLGEERRRQNPMHGNNVASSTAGTAKPPSYEDIFGDPVSLSLDPSASEVAETTEGAFAVTSTSSSSSDSALPQTVVIHSVASASRTADSSAVQESSSSSSAAIPVARQPSITVSPPSENADESDDGDDVRGRVVVTELRDSDARRGVENSLAEGCTAAEDPPPPYEQS